VFACRFGWALNLDFPRAGCAVEDDFCARGISIAFDPK
jgi:hypothetical protein